MELFFVANGIEDEKKVLVFFTTIGGEMYSLLHSLLAPAKPSAKSFAELKEVFQWHFEPKLLVIVERFFFHSWSQAAGESIAEYIAELQRLATNCKFGEYLEQALLDRLVCGLKHEPTQKRLLSASTVSLVNAIEIAQSVEAVEMNSLKLKGGVTTDVMQLVPEPPKKKAEKKVCKLCGNNGHQPWECCHECHKIGH